MNRMLVRSFSSSTSSHFLITNSLNHLLWCMDHNDSESFASLFTSDGTVQIVKTNTTFTGQEQLRGLCSGLYSKFYPALHFESNIVIDLDSKAGIAKNKSYWYAQKGGQIISSGFHFDELVLSEQNNEPKWLFRSRVIKHHWTLAGGFEEETV